MSNQQNKMTPPAEACRDFVRWWTGLPWSIRQAIVKDASDRCGALPGTFPLLDIVKAALASGDSDALAMHAATSKNRRSTPWLSATPRVGSRLPAASLTTSPGASAMSEFDTKLVYDRHSTMDSSGNMHVVGKWYFAVWQSWNAQGDYESAEIAEASGRRFCEKYSPVGVLLIGQWQHTVTAGDPVKSISLRKEAAQKGKRSNAH